MKKLFKGITYYIVVMGMLVGMAFSSEVSLSKHIKLTPIAVSTDKILFATQKYESTVSTVHPCAKTDFGWLVVSAAGIWDERNAYHYDCKKESKSIYEKYLQGKFTVRNPDKTLGEMMKKYEFYEYSVLEEDPYVYAIKPKQSCFKGKCLEKSTKQKTLDKLVSTKLHSSIRSSFYYKGVALFHNVQEDYTPSYPEPAIKKLSAKGTTFNLEAQGKKYVASYIDGLVLFDSYAFTQPKKETKKEVEAVVKEMFHLFNTKNLKAFNARFIHPKYGFYDMYRPGVSDHTKYYKKLEEVVGKGWTKEAYLLHASKKMEKIKWESVDTYCEFPTWNKEGVFVHQVPYASALNIMNIQEKFFNDKYSKNEKKRAKFLIEDVFVVVDTQADVLFYIKKIDGKWYLTHIDRVASDCSA